MNKQQSPKNIRPATTATPQGNTEARILDKDGNPKETSAQVEEQSIAEANKATGLSIFPLFSFAIPDKSDKEASGITGETGGMSYSKYAVLEARQAAQTDLATFIEYCKEASKACKDAAKALLTPHYEAFLEWGKALGMGAGNIKLDNGSKGSKLELAEDEYERSLKALFFALGKLSNTSYLGEKSNDGKPPKPSIFKNPAKVAKLEGFEGTNGKLKASAVVGHVITDEGGHVEYMLTQICHLATYVNHHNAEKAGELWNRLTGKIRNDQRIVLDPNRLRDLTQARMLGIVGAAFATAMQEALQAKSLKKMSDDDEIRLLDYRRNTRIAMNQAEDNATKPPKPEKLAGSKVEASDTKATLPQMIQKPLTEEDIALNRVLRLAGKQAETMMQEAITKGELDGDDLKACQAFYEEKYKAILIQLGEIVEPAEEVETSDDTPAETQES